MLLKKTTERNVYISYYKTDMAVVITQVKKGIVASPFRSPSVCFNHPFAPTLVTFLTFRIISYLIFTHIFLSRHNSLVLPIFKKLSLPLSFA